MSKATASSVTSRSVFRKARVLIVDDIALMRDMLRTTLMSFGFERFDQASDGDAAVSSCRNTKYDIIFLDIDMPGRDGLDALSEIRSVLTNAFVVMVSAHSSADNVKRARTLGADSFIVKPYALKKVVQLINKYHQEKFSADPACSA